LQKFHELMPDVPVAVLLPQFKRRLSDRELGELATYATFVNLHHRRINEKIIDRIHSRHMKVMAWNVKSPNDAYPLIHAGVDGMITKYPDLLIRN
jgi:glycerophosphoryl diester phosphodiesterase